MIRFVPHLLLMVLAFVSIRDVLPLFAAVGFWIVAAALPVWALFVPPARSLWRAFWLGPGTAVAIALAIWLPWDPGGDLGGVIKIMALAAIGIYLLYCIVVFSIAAWSRRRRW